MGIFDTLFGSEQEQESRQETTTKQEIDQRQTQEQERISMATGTQTQTGEKTGQQVGTTELFAGPEGQILTDLIRAFAGEATPSAGIDPALLSTLTERAVEAAPDRGEFLGDIEASARQDFGRTTGRALRRGIDTEVGSELNTISQQLRLDAGSEFEVDLAGELARAGLEFDQSAITNLVAAIQGGAIAGGESRAGGLDPLLQALGLARGATAKTSVDVAEQTTAEAAQQQETTELLNALSQLIGTTDTTSTTTGNVSQTGRTPLFGQITGGLGNLAKGVFGSRGINP